MSNRRNITTVALMAGLAAALTLGACSSGADEPVDAAPTTVDASAPDETAPETDNEPSSDAEEAPGQPQVFELIATEPIAAGPRPLLAWEPIEGAAAYDLIVLDAAGAPYWAWTGETSSVFIGGVENPDAVGAWVFEPLTWIVTARDAEGQPLAMSAKAELLPEG